MRASVALVLLVFPTFARAEQTTMHYQLYWGGFHAADVALVQDGGTEGYHTHLNVVTTGLADRLAGLTLKAESWGQTLGRGRLAPSKFAADTHRRGKETELEVGYDGNRGPARILMDETRYSRPPDEEQPRPPVPAELLVGTLDPLTAIIQIGQVATQARAEGNRGVMLPVFDGRLRYDVVAIVTGTDTDTIGGRDVSGLAVEITFSPRAGFKESSRQLWDGARFTALIDPVSGLPLRIVSKDFQVATVITAQAAPQSAVR